MARPFSDHFVIAPVRASGARDHEVIRKRSGHARLSGSSADPSVSNLPELPTVTESSAEAISTDAEPMTVLVGEQLLDDYQVIDLPDDPSTMTDNEAGPSSASADEGLVSTALLDRIEFLEAECSRLQKNESKRQHFGIDAIIAAGARLVS